MKLGLLVCDHVNPEFRVISGDYDDMFRRLFAGHPEVEVVTYDVIDGVLPEDPGECDLWLTTGSRHSVNDDFEWIRRLEGFVRSIAANEVPFVGVCFGHQLLAKALGGSVVKAANGWGVGLKTSEMDPEAGLGESIDLLYSHQDQVASLPDGAEVLGWTSDCPVSLFSVGGNMVGIQGHPEFDPEYSRALMKARRGGVIPEEVVDAGLETLGPMPDSNRVAEWIIGVAQKKGSRT
jgi:GMP synthase-like glutamine amidotransferase